jgi:hypothetical protein
VIGQSAGVGLLQSGGLEDVDDLVFWCDCFRHQLPDRVPLRQVVGFVISSFLLQRGPPQYRVNNASRNANSTGVQALASTSNAS